MLGYFIEVGSGNAERMLTAPLDARFIHRQTWPSAVRFTTAELARPRGEDRRRRATGLWRSSSRIFDELVAAVVAASRHARRRPPMRSPCSTSPPASPSWRRRQAIAVPRSTTALAFAIEGGRHPVVEQALAGEAGGFVANDCDLGAARRGAGRIWLVTGPNMAGKSTFLRQNALIAILAQIGAYVPAQAATIGVVDRLFSRVGAADDLARGRSTFMVEMVETAAILNQAGPARASSFSTRSAAAPPPSTACRSPGRRSSISTRSIAAAPCSPPTTTS